MKDIFLFLFYRNMIAEIWGKEVETKRWQQDYPKLIIIQQIQKKYDYEVLKIKCLY